MELYFDPQTISVDPDADFQVGVWLDTKGQNIDGTDIFIQLNGVICTGIMDDHLLPVTMVSDGSGQLIVFSQIVLPGTHFNGKGVLFTMNLKGSANATLEFDWTPGSTNRTVVASAGTNIITSVGNFQLIINPKSMALDPALEAGLKALAVQFNGTLEGTFTPAPTNTPPAEPFTVTP